MRKFALLAAVAFAVSSAANAQMVTKYSGIQPTEHPASYNEAQLSRLRSSDPQKARSPRGSSSRRRCSARLLRRPT